MLIFLLYHFIAVTITSCICPGEVLPFYDFKAVKLSYPNGTEIADENFFVIEIHMDSVDYLASVQKYNSLGSIINSAQATSCPEDGELGRKYEITNIEIVSNNDWDEEHPAGTSLTDLAYYGYRSNQMQEYDYDLLFSEELKRRSWEYVFIGPYSSFNLKLPKPLKANAQILTVRFTKTNGEVIVVVSEEIQWL